MRFLSLLVFFLFANAANVSHIAALGQNCLARFIVIAFVQAQVLRFLVCRHRALHDNGVERRCQKQMVVYVGTRDADRKWAASLLNKQALFDAQFGTVSGVRADAFTFGFACF